MFKTIYEHLKYLFTFYEELRALRQEQKEMRRTIEDIQRGYLALLNEIKAIQQDMGHLKEIETHEREKLMLRLENEMLKFERRLPPPRRDED